MQDLIEEIKKIADEDVKKHGVARLIYAGGEEFGEICKAIRNEELTREYNDPDLLPKEPSYMEAVDLLLTAVAMYHVLGGKPSQLEDNCRKKLNKWKNNIRRNPKIKK